ncbi:MAG: TIGR04282 family arsenosugar biosynthesis glycosyltransferase [Fibrobacteres bacterium]|nr:TIGR04282 family arsenosugar biosynthesis glycosyltransferase [Fibrobacterota bacterium]
MDLRFSLWLGGLVLFALWETLAPDRTRGLSRISRWPSNLGLTALSSVLLFALAPLSSAGAALWAEHQGYGLLRLANLDANLAMALAIPVLDVALWAQHVATHKVPWLWRLHRVHHLDTDLDVTTASRFHPVEILLSQVWMSLVALALGASPETVMLHATLVAAFAQFNHANVRLPAALEPFVASMFATPTFHRVHHSVIPSEANTHYGNVLSIWDRLAGFVTPRPRGGQDALVLGVEPWREPRWQRLDRLLAHPFLRETSLGKGDAMKAPWVLLFAKAPIRGTVKTRLAASCGSEQALEIYKSLAARQMAAIRQSALPCVIWTTGTGNEKDIASWLPGSRSVRIQPEGDLGVRMTHACDHAFASGAPGVILVGTDCPDLDASRLGTLASQVAAGRFVLQPANDGGYVAFGLPEPCRAAFQGIRWSTETVCDTTIRILHSLDKSPTVLESLSDIDTWEDWQRHEQRLLD